MNDLSAGKNDDHRAAESLDRIISSGSISLTGPNVAKILLALRRANTAQFSIGVLISKSISKEISTGDLQKYFDQIDAARYEINDLFVEISSSAQSVDE